MRGMKSILDEICTEALEAVPLKERTMQVYKMNDCDWMAANSPGEALQAYAEYLGETIYSLVYWSMVDNEIFECPLDEEMYIDLQGKELGKTTFGAVIAEHLARGDERPFFIASTEY